MRNNFVQISYDIFGYFEITPRLKVSYMELKKCFEIE